MHPLAASARSPPRAHDRDRPCARPRRRAPRRLGGFRSTPSSGRAGARARSQALVARHARRLLEEAARSRAPAALAACPPASSRRAAASVRASRAARSSAAEADVKPRRAASSRRRPARAAATRSSVPTTAARCHVRRSPWSTLERAVRAASLGRGGRVVRGAPNGRVRERDPPVPEPDKPSPSACASRPTSVPASTHAALIAVRSSPTCVAATAARRASTSSCRSWLRTHRAGGCQGPTAARPR